MATVAPVRPNPPTRLRVRVVGPDGEPLSSDDWARLLPDLEASTPRADRLRRCPCLVASDGRRTVGAAWFQRSSDQELRVPEVALDRSSDCGVAPIIAALVPALEAACLAGGCRRLLIAPPPEARDVLDARGYVRVGGAGLRTWMVRTFP